MTRIGCRGSWQERYYPPLDPSNVTKYFKKVLSNAGIRDQRFHDLRHCCSSLLLAQGVSPRTVMEILRHSQISLTMNTYSHVIPELEKQAVAQLDSLLAPQEKTPETPVPTPVGVNSGVIEIDLVTRMATIQKKPRICGAFF